MDDTYLPHNSSRVSPGDVFDRLTIKSVVKKKDRVFAICNCVCGADGCIIRLDSILRGDSRSCGCIHKEKSTTHGLSLHPLYHTWKNMHHRCYNPTREEWGNYGGRGIAVCERWHNLANFITDMYPTYVHGLLLDRIDVNKGYAPGNCRWVDWSVQSVNKRNVKPITYKGETKLLRQWCEEYGIRYVTAAARIKKRGWDPIEAFTTPPDARNPNAKPYPKT